MARQQPLSLKGFTAFVDGYGTAGVLESGKLPVVKIKTEGHRDGGMDGEVDIDVGLEKMTMELGFLEPSRLALSQVGKPDVPITLRGSIEDEAGTKIPVIAQARGLVTEADPGDWKSGEGAKTKLVCTPHYYRLIMGGIEVYEIDIWNGVRVVDGVDQLAARRRNLGL